MSLPPRVTVVIPCRNDAGFLDACLAALAAQTHPADHVIVVDNGSTDDSAAVARRHGVTLVEEGNVGIWPAAARGYDEAMDGADIIARLDADSRPHSDWIAQLVRAFVADPGLGVLTGGAEFYGGSALTNYLGENWYIGGGHYWVKKWLGIPLVFGSNFAMRTRVWRRVRDLVDRDNARIHDDLDLTIRLRPTDGVRYDPQLRMPVSARPLQTPGGLSRRVFRVATTFAASWPEGAAWRRRDSAQRGTDASAAAAGDWVPDGHDWAPELGR
ncbi:glycosyltransferase family 2 protein [Microbacterium sp. CFBP9034]|uniref:glycosyltransferase n=1 Tax=Microbacterium sp. CFBP9034 TaxID=3096540 RepID=UPI002A6B2DE6|nr:glycosyltransferase family 2 protein [Microbacterium sp. CFBP9034]MDY0910047.1 glycosyltransferase family 2 protein [Microbacterium sp. CFBP9034]